jgi:hypothetical protein
LIRCRFSISAKHTIAPLISVEVVEHFHVHDRKSWWRRHCWQKPTTVDSSWHSEGCHEGNRVDVIVVVVVDSAVAEVGNDDVVDKTMKMMLLLLPPSFDNESVPLKPKKMMPLIVVAAVR